MWIDGREWKLVPVEPTPEMLEAGAKQVDWYAHNALECYHAMLAAAPTPPAQAAPSDEHVSVVGMPEFDALLDHIYEHGTTSEGVLSRADALARALLSRYGQAPAASAEPVVPEAWKDAARGALKVANSGLAVAYPLNTAAHLRGLAELILSANSAPVAAQTPQEEPTNDQIDKAILKAAILDLAAIAEHLGIDPNEGGAVPIIEAIDELRRERNEWVDAGYAAQAPAADGDALDAARYRWLRSPDNPHGPSLVAFCKPDELDAAIDAARSTPATEKGESE